MKVALTRYPRSRAVLIVVVSLLALHGCGRGRDRTASTGADLPQFSIYREEVDDRPDKTQVTQRVVVSSEFTEQTIRALLDQQYREVASRRGFKYHKKPTHVVVYVYDSEAKAQAPVGQWFGMLAKFPDSREPAVVIQTGQQTSASQSRQPPARRSYRHSFPIAVDYDKMDDRTTVNLGPMTLGHGLSLQALFVSSGSSVRTPDIVALHFISNTEDWRYLQSRHLRLLLDDSTRLDLGEPDDNTTVGDGYVLEQMFAMVSLGQFLQIISAGKVAGRLGTTDFQLTEAQLEGLRDFGSRMFP